MKKKAANSTRPRAVSETLKKASDSVLFEIYSSKEDDTNKIKTIRYSRNNISRYIKLLKDKYIPKATESEDLEIEIQLFYNGVFINPDLTLDDIGYEAGDIIYVFASDAQFMENYLESSESQLFIQTMNSQNMSKELLKTAELNEKLYETFNKSMIANKRETEEEMQTESDLKYKNDICDVYLPQLDEIARKINLPSQIIYQLYKGEANRDIEKTRHFFDSLCYGAELCQ